MSDYSALDRFLHRIALGFTPFAELSFDLDSMTASEKPADAKGGRHVFVSGLARAGTTVLMRKLHESGQFGSLTYQDMPFVLAPRLWNKLTGRFQKHDEAKERAHGDGVLVSTDSPESFEEVFWRIFDGDAYIAKDRLLPHRPDADLCARFAGYVAAILSARGKSRYLSKNNNSILRLGALARTFPNASILVPFRDPVQQAASLLSQHQSFVASHRDDRFTAQYMTWLVHHEFGSDHRPFATHAKSTRSPETLDYWLDQWIGVYGWLAQEVPENVRFVCYEDLCENPAVWQEIASELGIVDRDGAGQMQFSRAAGKARRDGDSFDRLDEAMAIYERLRSHTSATAPVPLQAVS